MTIFAGFVDNVGWVNDTWVLENANDLGGTPVWTELTPSGGPPAVRNSHTTILSSATNRMMVFAGFNEISGGPAGGVLFNDVWVLTDALGVVNQPPVANAGQNQTAESAAGGANVTLDGSASSDPDAGDTLSYEWFDANGDSVGTGQVLMLTLPIGTHIFTLKVTDSAGGDSTSQVTVVVQDTTPPAISLPGDMTVEATDASGAAVSYTVSANDIVDGVVGVNCAPASGTTFPLGTTAVNCTATDAHANAASGSFNVTVRDTTPPALTLSPGETTVVVPASSSTCATVDLSSVASASDAVDPSVTITNNTPACFPIGSSVVTFTATDDSGNFSQKQFTVHVVYNFIGFLMPIRNDGSSVFRSGRTVPVKFQLTAADESFITNATATLQVYKVTDQVLGTVEEITPDASGSSNVGNLFRYDSASTQYIYNLSTSGYAVGTYLLRTTLNDGTSHDVYVSVR